MMVTLTCIVFSVCLCSILSQTPTHTPTYAPSYIPTPIKVVSQISTPLALHQLVVVEPNDLVVIRLHFYSEIYSNVYLNQSIIIISFHYLR